MMLMLIQLGILASSVAAQYYAPGRASWLGSSGLDPTPNWRDYLPIIYVVYGPDGYPHVRSIIDENDAECPSPLHKINTTGLLYSQGLESMTFESIGNPVNTDEMPYRFPVQVCGLTISPESIHREAIENGNLVLEYKSKNYEVPRATSNPSRFLLIGDTGLRVKPDNYGLGDLGVDNSPDGPDCTAPEIYGIHQCKTNFTQSDLTEPQTGDYQGLDEWYFKDMADSAAKANIDVIVYVGDYLYRQGACPLNNTQGANCSAINKPSFMNQPVTEGTIMNFIPGMYGDNWWGWWADFFYPALNLLKSAPLIPTRGNHEICSRAGYGFFLLLSPVSFEDYCLDYFPPYPVKFEHETFIVMDDSIIDPLYGGVDHYDPGQCPSGGSTITPIQENRYNDTSASTTEIIQQLQKFTNYFNLIEKYSLEMDTNFYVGHRPILGIGCNASQVVTLDWTLQQSLGPTTLDRINGIITGHMHWLEFLEFENNELPSQMIVGNGGTKLIANYLDQRSFPYINLKVGNPEYGIEGRVKRGRSLSENGYGIMERKENDYEVTFYTWDTSSSKMKPFDSFSIPKGVRKTSKDAGGNPGAAGDNQPSSAFYLRAGSLFLSLSIMFVLS